MKRIKRATVQAIADKLHRDACWKRGCDDTTSEDWNVAEALAVFLSTMGPAR